MNAEINKEMDSELKKLKENIIKVSDYSDRMLQLTEKMERLSDQLECIKEIKLKIGYIEDKLDKIQEISLKLDYHKEELYKVKEEIINFQADNNKKLEEIERAIIVSKEELIKSILKISIGACIVVILIIGLIIYLIR
jgi:DNA repair exonuclease SbcCD ATPase subunit